MPPPNDSNRKEVGKMTEPKVKIHICHEELDVAIEKANRLVDLLREAQQIVNSLFQPGKN